MQFDKDSKIFSDRGIRKSHASTTGTGNVTWCQLVPCWPLLLVMPNLRAGRARRENGVSATTLRDDQVSATILNLALLERQDSRLVGVRRSFRPRRRLSLSLRPDSQFLGVGRLCRPRRRLRRRNPSLQVLENPSVTGETSQQGQTLVLRRRCNWMALLLQ